MMTDRTSKPNANVTSAQVKPVAQVKSPSGLDLSKLEQAMAAVSDDTGSANTGKNAGRQAPPVAVAQPGSGKSGSDKSATIKSVAPQKPAMTQKPTAAQKPAAPQKPAVPVASRPAASPVPEKAPEAAHGHATEQTKSTTSNAEGMNIMVDLNTNPVTATAEAISDNAAKAQDAFRTNAREATERGQAALNEINARTRAATEKGQKLFEEVAEFQKGNFEAMIASGRVAAKGAEELARSQTEAARSKLEKANESFRTLAAAKSPTEFFRLQSEIAKSSLDRAVSDFAKSTETYVKLMNDIAQPLSNRYALAMDKTKTLFKA